MSGKKPWLGVVVGAGLVLNGCAGMTKNQAALVGAATCGVGGAGGGAMGAHNRDNAEWKGALIGGVGGALLCGGLAYLIAQDPKPPPPPPPPPPPAPQDTRRPLVHALRSFGRRGRIARLRYTVYDNSGITREAVVVFRGRRAIAGGVTDFGPARRGRVYFVRYRVPRKSPRKLTFCVQSEDRAGNRSRVSCAPLLIT
jgi:hypothetical protein